MQMDLLVFGEKEFLMLKPEASTGVIFWSGVIRKMQPSSTETLWDAIRMPVRYLNGWGSGPKQQCEQ